MTVNSWRDFANTVASVYTEDGQTIEYPVQRPEELSVMNIVGSALGRLLLATGFRSRTAHISFEERL